MAGLKIAFSQFDPDYAGVQLAFLYKLVSQETNYWRIQDEQRALKFVTKEELFIQNICPGSPSYVS